MTKQLALDVQHKPWWLGHQQMMKLRHKKTFHPVPSPQSLTILALLYPSLDDD
ncbi:MAG: hypothetical protein V7K42_17910 [Nostoc sp.]